MKFKSVIFFYGENLDIWNEPKNGISEQAPLLNISTSIQITAILLQPVCLSHVKHKTNTASSALLSSD